MIIARLHRTLHAVYLFGRGGRERRCLFYYRIINSTNVNIVINAPLVELLLRIGGERGTVDFAEGLDLCVGPEMDDLFDVGTDFRLDGSRIFVTNDMLGRFIERGPDGIEIGVLFALEVGNDLVGNCFQNSRRVALDGLGSILENLASENYSVSNLGVFFLADGAANGLLKVPVKGLGLCRAEIDAVEKAQLQIGVELSALSHDRNSKESAEDGGIVRGGKGDEGQEREEGEKKGLHGSGKEGRD